ncbi:MAG: hypothetical protein A3H98_11330 [Bacteroidetes bacterium RIFCSPLOWO2_02_FULL_36_8]|nr:MAG: hypothetical protein A3H98_11330 [Bacteroidetes bacterium RIFCSPLOWO2_02_FULL_36_8]OFY69229.1 MAG: hypothetical protein A3G23_06040 [Bacteroidetes bacterium RIFCSPLOWO2_12_FULL_37_12]
MADAFKYSYEAEYAGKNDEAIRILKNSYDEKSYEMNLRLGWLHYSSGLFSESMTYYAKAINLLPLSLEAKFGYTLPAAALGSWDKIENQYREILKIDTKNVNASYKLGLILYGKKEYAEAEKLFSNLVNQYPFEYNYVLTYAWIEYFLKKPREAKVLFNKVLLMSPADVSAQEGLGLIK